jgi:hypothetical protein
VLCVGGIVVVVKRGTTVPAWALLLVVGLGAILWLLSASRMTSGEQLAWHAVAIEEEHLQHLAHTLDTLQHVLTEGVHLNAIGDYVTHGILAPAKDMLTRNPADDIRLSILIPEGSDFEMVFWAGHNLTSAKKFSIPIKDSISRVAFESGSTETWDDVHTDARYEPHPKASRQTRSMISVPLTHGDQIVAVFNAVSDQAAAFNPADQLYIECLGSIVDVAVGILNAKARVDTTP